MQAYAIGSRKQFLEREITRPILLFDVGRQASALRIDDAHAQRDGAERQFPANFAQADDTHLTLIECYHSRDARPVTVRRVRAVVGRWTIAGVFQLLDADEVCVSG